jgi:hypothetical protein
MFGAHDHSYSVVCKKKGCGKMAECFVVYDYVTGRQGRRYARRGLENRGKTGRSALYHTSRSRA